MSRVAGLGLALALGLLVFLVDQGAKSLVEGSMRLGESIPLLPGVLHLTYIKNAGGAFGILDGYGGVLLIGSAVAIALVLWALLEGRPSRAVVAGCGLVLGGAAGNLLDRLTEGRVTDYVDLRVWPVFNAADVAIVFGAALLILSSLGSKSRQRPAADAKRGRTRARPPENDR